MRYCFELKSRCFKTPRFIFSLSNCIVAEKYKSFKKLTSPSHYDIGLLSVPIKQPTHRKLFLKNLSWLCFETSLHASAVSSVLTQPQFGSSWESSLRGCMPPPPPATHLSFPQLLLTWWHCYSQRKMELEKCLDPCVIWSRNGWKQINCIISIRTFFE